MTSPVFYVVVEPSNPTGLQLVNLVEFMDKGDCREIIKPGKLSECEEFMSQYTADKPYVHTPTVRMKEPPKPIAGKVKTVRPLVSNDVLTPEEKTDIFNKVFEDAGFMLHAAMIYCGEVREIEATVIANTGEKYLLTFKRIVE